MSPTTAGPGDRVRVDLDADVDSPWASSPEAAGQPTFSLHSESTMQVTYAPPRRGRRPCGVTPTEPATGADDRHRGLRAHRADRHGRPRHRRAWPGATDGRSKCGRSASLAGTRVLGLDLKWRAVNAGNPSPPPGPSRIRTRRCATRSTMRWHTTPTTRRYLAIDCFGGSDEATYVKFDDPKRPAGRSATAFRPAQGVKVWAPANPTRSSWASSASRHRRQRRCDRAGRPRRAAAGPAHAVRRAEPARVLCAWRPVPDPQRGRGRMRCRIAAGSHVPRTPASSWPRTSSRPAGRGFCATPPSVPVANSTQQFAASITVALSAENGAKIHYTTDGVTVPTAASPKYSSAADLHVRHDA